MRREEGSKGEKSCEHGMLGNRTTKCDKADAGSLWPPRSADVTAGCAYSLSPQALVPAPPECKWTAAPSHSQQQQQRRSG